MVQTNDVLGPLGRKKLRALATSVDALGHVVNQAFENEQRLQRVLHGLQEEERRLPLQLEALMREAPKKTEAELQAFNDSMKRMKAEIERVDREIVEIRSEIAQARDAVAVPRQDRKAMLAFIETVTKFAGDEGARLRAQMRGAA